MQSSSCQRCCGTAVRLLCELLEVVCVEVMAYIEAVIRICHVLCIDCELLRTDCRALRKTTRQTNWPRAVIWHLECLQASGVIRVNPLQLRLFDAELIWSVTMSISRSTVSSAELRFNNTRTNTRPMSMIRAISLWTLMTAVSVEWCCR